MYTSIRGVYSQRIDQDSVDPPDLITEVRKAKIMIDGTYTSLYQNSQDIWDTLWLDGAAPFRFRQASQALSTRFLLWELPGSSLSDMKGSLAIQLCDGGSLKKGCCTRVAVYTTPYSCDQRLPHNQSSNIRIMILKANETRGNV